MLPMEKWEYKAITQIINPDGTCFWIDGYEMWSPVDRLNDLGNDGWEVVNMLDVQVNGTTTSINIYLKRRK
jgi:hypothetical protein